MNAVALFLLTVLAANAAAAESLQSVGALGNSSTLQEPVPYAFYTGLALDGAGGCT